MQQKSVTTKMKGGIMKTLSNPLLKFDTYIDIKTAPEGISSKGQSFSLRLLSSLIKPFGC